MKKLFTLAAAVLASVSMWAATETQPSSGTSNEAIVGTSYTFAGTYVAGAGSVKAGAMTSKGIKIRLNRASVSHSEIANALEFTVNEGYAINSITIVGVTNSDNKAATVGTIYVDGVEWNGSFDGALPAKNAGVASNIQVSGIEAQSSVVFAFSDLGGASQGNIEWTIEYAEAKNCTDPEAVLALSKTAMFVNEEADLTFTTKGTGIWTSEVTLNGETAELGTDYNMTGDPFSLPLAVKVIPLKAGTFEITMTQEAWDGYCAVEEKVTAEVSAANPVTAVSIDGPATGFVGQELTYTATAVGATAYEWYLDDVKQGSDSAKFIYTAVKGNHSIVCKARNEFNAEDAWIASDPIALKVTSLQGEIIKATLTSGSAATVTGLVGGTADVNLSSSQKMDNGRYFGITLASGTFQEGDTVVIVLTKVGSNYPCLFGDKDRTILLYLAKETSGALEYKIVLPAAANGLSSLYLSRNDDDNYKWNPTISSIAVIRPEQPDHVDVALVGVTIDGEALPSDFVTHLINEGTFTILTSYVDAPTVTFVKHSDIYYEGETEPVSTNDSIKVTATEVEGEWQAQATIGENTYTITMAKAASFTVHYMEGENELGTESVAANGTVAKYADFQSKTMATFVGWYQDVDLTIEAVLTAPVTAETYLYAKFENKYAASINIEQLVLDNGKSYNLLNALGTNGYATNWTNDLDSLNNEKEQRNYAYLGQKVKAAGKMIDFRLAQGSTVKVKFGNAPADIKVVINDVANTVEAAALANPYEYTAAEETYISIRSTTDKTLVFKQIMINEDIQTVVLPALYTVTYNAGAGECEVATAETQFSGDVVILPAATREGYTFDGWFDAAEEGELIGVAGAEYTPSADITLYAQYTADEEETGCEWSKLSWIGDGSPEQTFGNQFKVCVGDPAPAIVNIQKPGFASESGIYMTFPSAAFTSISLDETMYDIQGAGIIFHLSAFSNKETEVTVVCQGENYVFTVYNDKGIATAIDNTEAAVKAQKVLRDGQLYIIYNGKTYNVQGAAVK